VCWEAPAPKLLLLICNPLRAGGKGIRGINGLAVTTTIISSGCLGQAVRTRTGLCTPHGHTPTAHTNTSAHAGTQTPVEQSTSTQVWAQARTPACAHADRNLPTPTRAPTRKCRLAHGPLARAHVCTNTHRPLAHASCVRTRVHAQPHTQPCVCTCLHPSVHTRAPAHAPMRARTHTPVHACTHMSASRPQLISAINPRQPQGADCRGSDTCSHPRSLTN